MLTPEHAVVEVSTDATDVVMVCHACPDGRRLPNDHLALRVGVAAFLDEHGSCGPVSLTLPLDVHAPQQALA